MLKARLTSVRVALTSFPSREAVREFLAMYGIYAVFAVGLGTVTGFLEPRLVQAEVRSFLALVVRLFLGPALIEELVYRALLIPHPVERRSRKAVAISAVGALILFVLSHPVNGLFIRHEVLKTFTDPVYLILVTGLGMITTLAYLRSGSLWPSVVMHWLTVIAWIAFFGGGEKLALSLTD